MKNQTFTTTIALCVLSANIAFAQVSTPQTPSIELLPKVDTAANITNETAFPYSIELTAAQCGAPAKWSQSSGPSGVEILGSGSQALAQVHHSGNYEFEYACCNVSTDRKSSLLNSNSLIGFGKNTTGGVASNGFTVVTSTKDSGPGSLREALSLTGPNWITFDPALDGKTIYLDSIINIKNSNITIDGRDASVTISTTKKEIFLMTFRGGNTIIHGIKFDGNGTDSTALMLREGLNYWVDHVTITNFRKDDALSIGQGNRPDTSASEVTISNYRAVETSKGIQAGGNGNFPDFPRTRVTVHTSELAADERNPRVQYGGIFHVFNTYIHSFVYGGMDVGRNAQVISENNVFSALSAKSAKTSQTGRYSGIEYPLEGPGNRPVGHIYSKGDLFIDSATSSGSINPTNPSPFVIPYSYELLDVNLVRETVLQNAGVENIDSSLNQCQVQRISRTVP